MSLRDEQAKPNLSAWNTEFASESERFSYFREAICEVYMPWAAETRQAEGFSARGESISLNKGIVGKLWSSQFSCGRTKIDIATTPIDCAYANYVLHGELKVVQAGREHYLKAGELIVFDGTEEVLSTTGDGSYELLALVLPKRELEGKVSIDFRNVGAVRDTRILRPLLSCLDYLDQQMSVGSSEQLSSVLDASLSLLSLAVTSPSDPKPSNTKQSAFLLGVILRVVEDSLSDPSMTPGTVAARVGITTRYLHKLFSTQGTTFNVHVMNRRLDMVRRDLATTAPSRTPIADIAFRWGFKDLSTLHRAFKSRFGRSPSAYRSPR